MADPTVEDLLVPLTRVEIEAKIYYVLATVGATTSTWKPGSVVRAIITAVAVVLAALSSLFVQLGRSAFLDYAFGSWLTIVARYVYGVRRIAATFATGTLTINNSGGATYEFDAGDLIAIDPATGKTFRNVAAVSVGSLQIGVSALFIAVEGGSASSAIAGAVSTFETSWAGLTCTNASAWVGADEETDSALRSRCRAKASALSPNGPRDAYDYFARVATLTDGTNAGVTRTKVNEYSETAAVTVIAATAAGNLPGATDDPSTPLGAVTKSLRENALPLGVTLTLAAGTPGVVNVTAQVWYYTRTTLTSAELETKIRTSLATFFANQPIGGNLLPSLSYGYVYTDGIISAIRSADPEIVHVVLTIPSANVGFTYNQVPALGSVTLTLTPVNTWQS